MLQRIGLREPYYTHVPDELLYLWEWFWKLSRRRKSGPEALSALEITTWADALGLCLDPGEFDALCAMDDAFLYAVGQNREDDADVERQRADAAKKLGAAKKGR